MSEFASMGIGVSIDAVQDAATFPFSKLPRELRDQIFDLLWSNTLIAFRHEGFITIARYKFSSSPVVLNSLPPWLATTRQICDEGMDQFYRRAHFSLGEHVTLPLYLHRRDSARPYMSSREHLSASTDKPGEREPVVLQVSSDLLNLKRARTLKIEKLCVRLGMVYGSRADCHQRKRGFCSSGCCSVHLNVSIGTESPYVITPEGDRDATYPRPYIEALEELLKDDSNQLRDLELDIIPHSPRRKGSSALGYARYLWMKCSQLEAETTHYDWSILDKLPRNLRRINIGVIEDTITTRGWPNFFVLALQQVRNKCEKVVAELVELHETSRAQEVYVAHWSYVRSGKRLRYYSQPEHQRTPTEMNDDFLCSRWEVFSPLRGSQYSHVEDIDSIVERSGVGDSIISQRTTSRSTVIRRV